MAFSKCQIVIKLLSLEPLLTRPPTIHSEIIPKGNGCWQKANTAIAVATLFLLITMPQSAYKLRKDPTCYIDAYIHSGSRPCWNKGLVKLITCGPEGHHNYSKERPSPVPRRNGAAAKRPEQ